MAASSSCATPTFDGAHIRTCCHLLLPSHAHTHDSRHLYIAQPPLFHIKMGSKNIRYVDSYEERDASLPNTKSANGKEPEVGRYKGLVK